MNQHSLNIYNADLNKMNYWLNHVGDYSVLLNGFCHTFALLSNKLFNKPICILTEQRYLDDIPVKGLLHAFIMLDDSTIFDFEGTRTLEDIKAEFIKDQNNYELSIVEPNIVWMMLYGSLPLSAKFYGEPIILKIEDFIKDNYIDFVRIEKNFRKGYGS